MNSDWKLLRKVPVTLQVLNEYEPPLQPELPQPEPSWYAGALAHCLRERSVPGLPADLALNIGSDFFQTPLAGDEAWIREPGVLI